MGDSRKTIEIFNSGRSTLVTPSGIKLGRHQRIYISLKEYTEHRAEYEKLKDLNQILIIHSIAAKNDSRKTTTTKENEWLQFSDSYYPQSDTPTSTDLPVPLEKGAEYLSNGERYIWNGKKWVLSSYASGRILVYPVNGKNRLFIDITGVELADLGLEAYNSTPSNGNETSEITKKFILYEYIKPVGKIALDMGVVNGRDCNFRVYRIKNLLLMEFPWKGHTMEDTLKLLKKLNITL